MKIDSIRKEYKFSELTPEGLHKNPVSQFEQWLNEAINAEIPHPTAMSVSTLGADGFPQSRIVLLKFFDDRGFMFFTNYNSEKGISIANNPAVGLHFYWPQLERQVRISGFAKKTSQEISDRYFLSRPLSSQIGAWVSEQSKEIPSRKILDNRFIEYRNRYKNQVPPKPGSWGGYLVKPAKIEFWQGRENRLHDRFLFEKQNKIWLIKRLAP